MRDNPNTNDVTEETSEQNGIEALKAIDQSRLLTFLSIQIYILVTLISMKDEMLILKSSVPLPFLNIQIPTVGLFGFSTIAPLLILIFHIYLLLQLSFIGLDCTLNRYKTKVSHRPLFIIALALILIIFPSSLLLVIQGWYLKYHSSFTTHFHRLIISLDILLIIYIYILKILSSPHTLALVEKTFLGFIFSYFVSISMLSFYVLEIPDGHYAIEGNQKLKNICSNFFNLSPEKCAQWSDLGSLNLQESQLVANENLAAETINDLRTGTLEKKKEVLRKISPLSFFQGADMHHAKLFNAILPKLDLRAANNNCQHDSQKQPCAATRAATRCNEPTQLQGSNLKWAQMQMILLDNANLQGADLEGAQLQYASLQGTDFLEAKLASAQLQEANFYTACLENANLREAKLQGANLNDTQLQLADLSGAQLEGADLSHAQLQGANLENAQLQAASLVGANLVGANLKGANLQGADFSKAQIQYASFSDFDIKEVQSTHDKYLEEKARSSYSQPQSNHQLGHAYNDEDKLLGAVFNNAIFTCIDQFKGIGSSLKNIASLGTSSEEKKYFENKFNELLSVINTLGVKDKASLEEKVKKLNEKINNTCQSRNDTPSQSIIPQANSNQINRSLLNLACGDTEGYIVRGLIRQFKNSNSSRMNEVDLAEALLNLAKSSSRPHPCPGLEKLSESQQNALTKVATKRHRYEALTHPISHKHPVQDTPSDDQAEDQSSFQPL